MEQSRSTALLEAFSPLAEFLIAIEKNSLEPLADGAYIPSSISRKIKMRTLRLLAAAAKEDYGPDVLEAIDPFVRFLRTVERRYADPEFDMVPLSDDAYVPDDITRHICVGILRKLVQTLSKGG